MRMVKSAVAARSVEVERGHGKAAFSGAWPELSFDQAAVRRPVGADFPQVAELGVRHGHRRCPAQARDNAGYGVAVADDQRCHLPRPNRRDQGIRIGGVVYRAIQAQPRGNRCHALPRATRGGDVNRLDAGIPQMFGECLRPLLSTVGQAGIGAVCPSLEMAHHERDDRRGSLALRTCGCGYGLRADHYLMMATFGSDCRR